MRWIKALLVVALLPATLGASGAQAAVTYRQPVWFNWNSATLETIVVPPNHGQIVNGNGVLAGAEAAELNPLANSYLRAIERSIADWTRAIDRYGPTWLKNGFRNNVYVLGRDDIPPQVLQRVDILVTTDVSKAFAIGMAVRFGARCLVLNSKFFVTSMTEEDMYSINGHEYGHCLGLFHVDEASPPNPNDDNIRRDLMHGTYPHSPGTAGTPRQCISNLNVKGLEEVFRQALRGQAGASNGEIAKSDYRRINC